MGYYVEMVTCVTIPKKNINACLNAINELHTDKNLLKYAGGGVFPKKGTVAEYAWYSWVDNPPNGKFENLQKALLEWRYDNKVDKNGNVIITYFHGEKWGDDELLFKTIAPFVKNNSTIEVTGEDDNHWRYVFSNKQVKMEKGKVVYESD